MAAKPQFVILTRPSAPGVDKAAPSFSPMGGGARRGGTRGPGPRAGGQAAAVEVRALDDYELREVRQTPGKQAAKVLPLRLIEPTQRAALKGKAAPDVWGLGAIGVKPATLQGEGTVVAVLDTGIDAKHEAFKHLGTRLVTKNFTRSPDDDRDGHGTHCAGTIFGGTVQGTRIGVAPKVDKALVGKVLGTGADTNTLVTAVQWAVDQGANVISMSLGVDFPGYAAELQADGYPPDIAASIALQAYRDNVRLFDTLSELVRARGFGAQTSILVAAAGNESRADENAKFLIGLGVPAAADGFVSVGALGRNGKSYAIAPFSNTGPTVAAPGVDIVSAKKGGGLTLMSGTSMAAPHVAGVAALWLQKMTDDGALLSAENLRANLMGRAQPIPLKPVRVGAGLVQVPQ